MNVVDGIQQIHRIGGRDIANLRLKDREKKLDPPGISVIIASTADEARQQIRRAFPRARELREQSKLIASSSASAIRLSGFDVVSQPTKSLPNHCRITHPLGAAGFNDVNLARLAEAFIDVAEPDHEHTQHSID
jgi:hypothetical protein